MGNLQIVFNLLLFCNIGASFNIAVINDVIDNCVLRVVDHIFTNEKKLYFIFENDDCDVLPFGSDKPKVIINTTNTKIHVTSQYKIIPPAQIAIRSDRVDEGHLDEPPPKDEIVSTEYGFNMLIQAKNCKSLENILDDLYNSSVWNKNESPRGVFLILTEEGGVERMYPMLWRRFIQHAVILTYETNDPRNIPKLYTSNPYDTGNNCGQVAKIYSEQLCDDPALKPVIPISPKNYNGCPVQFVQPNYLRVYPQKQTWVTITRLTLSVLRKHRNIGIRGGVPRPDLITFTVSTDDSSLLEPFQQSYIIANDIPIIVVPIPSRISQLEIFVFIFKIELWVMVAVGFFITSFIWLLIQGIKKNEFCSELSLMLLNVLSVTLWGTISSVPRRFALRVIFASYVIVCIHLQTAYISSLVTVLTIPQYEKGITSIQELCESDIWLAVGGTENAQYFTNVVSGHELYNMLHQKVVTYLVSLTGTSEFEEKIKNNNFSMLVSKEELLVWQAENNITISNKLLVADWLLGSQNYKFTMTIRGHYFMDTLNGVIATLRESGIYVKFEEEISAYYRKWHAERVIEHECIVLGLNHIYGVFVILGFGLTLSTIIFFMELIIYKWRSRSA